jgi:hypothetical protein
VPREHREIKNKKKEKKRKEKKQFNDREEEKRKWLSEPELWREKERK